MKGAGVSSARATRWPACAECAAATAPLSEPQDTAEITRYDSAARPMIFCCTPPRMQRGELASVLQLCCMSFRRARECARCCARECLADIFFLEAVR